MEQICLEGVTGYAGIATAVVTGASLLANIVSENNIFGKAVKYLALNFKVKKV